MQPLFLQPVFQERIWGGSLLRDQFQYNIPSGKTGECWAVSAQPQGMSIVAAGTYQGRSLDDLWQNERALFGLYAHDSFPLLTKLLDANDTLSVQVHPDDHYAQRYEGSRYGKTECWYIVDCMPGAEVILGHYAKSAAELRQMVEQGQWAQLLRRVQVKPGDFFYIPSGTLHALCGGVLVWELQQSSDITYRVYDYDRVDDQGKKRALHVEQALAVIAAPYYEAVIVGKRQSNDCGCIATTYIDNEFFAAHKWEIAEQALFEQRHFFRMLSVLKGRGVLESDGKTYAICQGDHFIVPALFGPFTLTGRLELMAAHL